MTNFSSLGLCDVLGDALMLKKLIIPTPIQEQAIPLLLKGQNVLASAQTGTGKTLAYALPLLQQLISNPVSSGLILVPTRELAIQVRDSIRQIWTEKGNLKLALLIGGESMMKQFSQLKVSPRLVIGTPGRIIDHLKRRSLNLQKAQFWVLDETDRMLDMGFSVQLEEIAQHLPEQRQTMMFSATLPKSILRLAHMYLGEHERICIDNDTKASENVTQELIRTPNNQKYPELLNQLNTREGSIIVFVKTKRSADSLADKLYEEGHRADAFHGDLNQRKREQVVRNFRTGRNRVLVCTDIAARGLDIPHVRHVINYDLPQCPEDYIHRIGRTGRAGALGSSLCLIGGAEDNRLWYAIEKMMDPEKAGLQAVNNPEGRRKDGKERSKPSQKKWKGRAQESTTFSHRFRKEAGEGAAKDKRGFAGKKRRQKDLSKTSGKNFGAYRNENRVKNLNQA